MENTYKLGRIVKHDSRSLSFAFDTTGLSIIDVEHKRLIPVLNQGQVGSCTGNAGIGAINTEPFPINTKVYSPDEEGALKLYHDAQVIDGGIGYPPEDSGSSGLSVAKALYNAGIISNYQHTFTLNDALKALSVYTIISGMNWFSQMFTPDPDGRVHPIGIVEGGHEVEGYKVDIENRRIWFYNSWVNPDGTLWGLNGTFYLTWEDFSTLLDQQGDVIVLIPMATIPPAPVPMPVLRIGSKGVYVKTLQTDLNKFGATLTIDGDFGPLTQQAVIAFQTKMGLVPDSIVGPLTWTALQGTVPPVATSNLDKWCSAIKTMEGANPVLNNPGNLRFVGQAFATDNNGFCQFDTYEHGYEALQSLITRACKGQINPPYNQNGNLYDFYNVYAPSSDNNNPKHYAEFVAGVIGVSPLTIISTLV